MVVEEVVEEILKQGLLLLVVLVEVELVMRNVLMLHKVLVFNIPVVEQADLVEVVVYVLGEFLLVDLEF